MPSSIPKIARDFLKAPTDDQHEIRERQQSLYQVFHDYDLAKIEGYQQQYGDMYFLRLAKLKPAVEAIALEAWQDFKIGSETVRQVDRVLDVRQGEFCWVAGTIYMDMPLKPNILDDISKDHWISAPPPREKYASPDGTGVDRVMLEDESGRLRLIGPALDAEMLVTGCIVAAMGTENANGDFEVIDIKIPDLAPQPARWALPALPPSPDPPPAPPATSGKIAFVSGLNLTGTADSLLALDLLGEFLTGESAAPGAARVTRLVVAGNSLARANPLLAHEDQLQPAAARRANPTAKKYGYDASAYDPLPPAQLDAFLADLLPSLPVTVLPGASDPANVSLPQQPLHAALFPLCRVWADPPAGLERGAKAPPAGGDAAAATATAKKRSKATTPKLPFHCATNPALLGLAGHLTLVTGGQPTGDIARYVEEERYGSTIDLLEATMRWRLTAPTAPDTLWCYPYQKGDPFVVEDGKCPRLYVVGNCERFETREVRAGEDEAERVVRCICLPEFSKTGEVVLVDEETLVPEVIRFIVHD